MRDIYSMTGYASLRGSVRDSVAFTLAMKSVNHRFLDLHLRLPGSCDGMEIHLRRMLKENLRRGHIELTLQLERRANVEIQLNPGLLEAYVQAFREAASTHGVSSEPDLNAMLRIPGVMSTESVGGAAEIEGLDAAVLSQICDGISINSPPVASIRSWMSAASTSVFMSTKASRAFLPTVSSP